jgi:hypothetical protein
MALTAAIARSACSPAWPVWEKKEAAKQAKVIADRIHRICIISTLPVAPQATNLQF